MKGSRLMPPSFRFGGTAFLLAVFGVLTIISSQSASARPLYLALRQSCWIVTGFAAFSVVSRIPFSWYRRQAFPLAAAGIILLLLLPICGSRINGMRGWFRMGSISMQPSEVVKAIYLLSLSSLLAWRRRGEWRDFGAAAALAGMWLLPLAIQPDFGTSLVYGGVFLLLAWLAGIGWRPLVTAIVAGGIAAAAAVFRHPYVARRVWGFLNPEADPLGSGWHLRQFEMAIARGGFTGSKLGGAVWSNAYLPLPYNDSAFATMAETLGLVGLLLPASLFVLLIWWLCAEARREELSLGARFYLAGCAALLGLQALIHVSVNAGLMPATGLTLPFISYGGSSMTGCFLMLGIAVSAAREDRADSGGTPNPAGQGGASVGSPAAEE